MADSLGGGRQASGRRARQRQRAALPVANPAAQDAAAEGDVAELKAQVEAVRAAARRMSLSPAQKVPLCAQGEDRNMLKRNAPYQPRWPS